MQEQAHSTHDGQSGGRKRLAARKSPDAVGRKRLATRNSDANGRSHHEKLLIPATGIVPSGTREYEDTFPCRVLLFPCTSLKNHIPVLHTGIDISYWLV